VVAEEGVEAVVAEERADACLPCLPAGRR